MINDLDNLYLCRALSKYCAILILKDPLDLALRIAKRKEKFNKYQHRFKSISNNRFLCILFEKIREKLKIVPGFDFFHYVDV